MASKVSRNAAMNSGVPKGTPSATKPRWAESKARLPTQTSLSGASESTPTRWTPALFQTRVLPGLRRSWARCSACLSKRC